MDHSRSSASSKRTSKPAPSTQPASGKTSMCTTWSSLVPSTRAKSPAQNPSSRAQSPIVRAPSPGRASPVFEDTLKRMKTYEEKSHLTFEKTRQFLEQQQALELLSEPPNTRSQQLAAGVPPIEKRYETILETREKRREALTQITVERRLKEEMKEVCSTPKTVSKPRRLMSPEQFFEYTEQWAEHVAKKKENIRKTIETKEQAETTFTPKVNGQRTNSRPHSPLYTRVDTFLTSRDAKVKSLARTLTPTFTPQTNVKKPAVGTPRGSATSRGRTKAEVKPAERPNKSPLRAVGKEPRSSLSVLKSILPDFSVLKG